MVNYPKLLYPLFQIGCGGGGGGQRLHMRPWKGGGGGGQRLHMRPWKGLRDIGRKVKNIQESFVDI